jgi:pimeloyl-ACP methyl ester carboxylesterase
LVALEMALQNQADTAGVVLISGYYFGSIRPDVLLVAPAAVPVLGTVLRHTVSPLVGWLTMPLFKRLMFAPGRMTPRFAREYAASLALRPSQLHASAADGVRMIPAALGLWRRYKGIYVPTVILAGAGDRIVRRGQAERLQKAVPGSVVRVVPGVGHMLHHAVPDLVAGVIDEMAEDSAVRSRNRAPV